MTTSLTAFLCQSLAIEGIHRDPTADELGATAAFLRLSKPPLEPVCFLQAIYAPRCPLRDKPGMNVMVGAHVPPVGGPEIATQLSALLATLPEADPWRAHCQFEALHPFMDGNGRTGRAIWLWHMIVRGRDPFGVPFLQRFYYDTLAAMERVE